MTINKEFDQEIILPPSLYKVKRSGDSGSAQEQASQLLTSKYFLPTYDVFHDYVIYLESILKDLHTVEAEQNVLIEIYMLQYLMMKFLEQLEDE